MASTKESSKAKKNHDTAVHSETTATMLTFAEPPADSNPETVATECSRQGFTSIGIAITGPNQIIDFSLIDDPMCADLAASIEICVDSKGFFIPALTGTLQTFHAKGVQIKFSNFAKGIASLMKPKSEVLG
jgi:hypothetical protein